MTSRNVSHKKKKAGAWFIRVRGSYLPSSLQGWLTYIPFTAYLVFSMIIAWRDSSSHSIAVLYIIPNWIAAAVVLTWIAARKS